MESAHRARLAALDALFGHPELGRQYVLKGGLPLHHVFGSPRRSEDLDFNSVERHPNTIDEGKEHRLVAFAHQLDAAMAEVAPRYGLAAMIVQNKRLSDVLPTLLAEVGYTEQTEAEPPFSAAIEMQATLSEVVCAWQPARLGGVEIVVPTLEDLVADKLKALLQQATRADVRATDTWDLWYLLTHFAPDGAGVADFLHRKCAVWPRLGTPDSARFHAPAVRDKAAAGYAHLSDEHPDLDAPPFDVAYRLVLRFVEALPPVSSGESA